MTRAAVYKPELADLARNYVLLGATESELGPLFGVTARCIRKWKREHPEFAQALSEGGIHANAKVVGALYRNCIAGDTASIVWWTKNKMGWRDRSDMVAKIGISPIDELLSEIEGTSFKPKDGV